MRGCILAFAILATPFFCSVALCGDSAPPSYSGTWELNAAQSHPAAGDEAVTYTIKEAAGQINFTRVVHGKDGKDVTSQFSCKTGGSQCEYDEGGFKAKVSLWYDGPALMILKTDGPKEDAVVQWKLSMGSDPKTLNVEVEHIDPADKSEELVFNKKP